MANGDINSTVIFRDTSFGRKTLGHARRVRWSRRNKAFRALIPPGREVDPERQRFQISHEPHDWTAEQRPEKLAFMAVLTL
jgi:hypothetical protein